jgi:hypothetical protein
MRTGSGTALSIGVGNGQINVAGSTNFLPASVSTAVPYHAWTHVAVVRSGTGTDEVTVYINGVSAATGTCADNFTTTSVTLANRYTSTSPNTTNCYLSNFRISNTARSITLPTAPYTSDANTLLLLCQSNRNIDNGPDARTVTTPDAVKPSITPFSPFAPSAAYDPAVNGGSGYFDGTGDYLTAPDNAALNFDGQFTIEAWIYRTSGSANQTVMAKWGLNNEAWLLLISSNNTLIFYYEASNITTTATIPVNAWCHVAVTRDSSNDIRIFVDGVQTGSTTNSNANITNTTVAYVGAYNSTGSVTAFFPGYISNARVVKGTAVYTAAFTPPTAPLTAITNTSLLLNFTNAGIIDSTAKNNLETVGNAQVDTTTKKFGTGSMEFDGTGDYLAIKSSENLLFHSGDFTIEAWVYLNSLGSDRGIYDCRSAISSVGAFYISGSNNTVAFYDGTVTATGTALTSGTWNHVAWVRSGTTLYGYLNGVQQWTRTLSTNVSSIGSLPKIGTDFNGTQSFMNGFIDDLRITKGVARYTANFTAPTKAFPDQ